MQKILQTQFNANFMTIMWQKAFTNLQHSFEQGFEPPHPPLLNNVQKTSELVLSCIPLVSDFCLNSFWKLKIKSCLNSLINIIPGNCIDGKFVPTIDWDNISKRGVFWINCGNKFPIQRVSWNYNEWDREKIGRKVASDRIRKVKFWKDLFFHKTKIHLESSLLLKTFVCIQCQTFNSIRIASSTSLLKVHIVHPKLVDMFWLRVCHCDLTVQTVLVATKSALRTHYYHFSKLSPVSESWFIYLSSTASILGGTQWMATWKCFCFISLGNLL